MQNKINNNQLALIAIVAALALFGVVMVTVATTTMQLKEAEARPFTSAKSCDFFGGAYNASKGRCFNP
jgi:hypothetical protein